MRDQLLEGMPFGATPPPPELSLYSDASQSGWGAHLLDQSVSGLWSNQETSLHINILRDEGSVPGASGLSGHDHQPVTDSNVRQLPLRVDRTTSLLDRSLQRTHGSEVPPRTIKRPHGSPQPPQPCVRCGVVPPLAGSKEDHLHLGVYDN